MGLKVVTYEGSDNPGETVFYVGGSRLDKGTPTAIPDADAKLLTELTDAEVDEGHAFKIGNAAPKGAEHGSVVVDGEVRGSIAQPAVAAEEAEAEDAAPAGASTTS